MEIMSKRIVVPKNEDAVEMYNYNMYSEEDVLILPINEEDFCWLYDNQVIEEINNRCHSLIDEYEEEDLSGEQIIVALAVISDFMKKYNTPILNDIKNMLTEAKKRNSIICFEL